MCESSNELGHELKPVVKVLRKTILSPSFCLLLPLTLLSQAKSTGHPAFIWSAVWTGLVCLISRYLAAGPFFALQQLEKAVSSEGD
jgi:hypothetical protein